MLTDAEKLQAVEEIRKSAVAAIRDILGRDNGFNVDIYLFSHYGHDNSGLINAAVDIGWEYGHSYDEIHHWMKTNIDLGRTSIHFTQIPETAD